jgi:hypothetical protein
MDVGGLLGQFVRLDHELLDDRRVEAADEDRGQDQQPEAHCGQHRAAPGGPREEQQGAQDGDHREDGLGRQHRVDVGVGGAGGDRAPLGEVDAVPVDPVRHGLEQHKHAE